MFFNKTHIEECYQLSCLLEFNIYHAVIENQEKKIRQTERKFMEIFGVFLIKTKTNSDSMFFLLLLYSMFYVPVKILFEFCYT